MAADNASDQTGTVTVRAAAWILRTLQEAGMPSEAWQVALEREAASELRLLNGEMMSLAVDRCT